MSEALTVADVIARRLYDAGCRFAFGIPGGEVLSLIDALDRAGLKVLLAKHENCAGFMGEGVHHHDGAPAVLFATIGPGLANAANVIANAQQDRVPMIVLTGCVPTLEGQTYTHQVFDHVKLAESVAKAAFRVEPGTAAVVADKAIALATQGRPGPVVIDVPIDLQKAAQETWHAPRRRPLSPTAPAAGADLDKARDWFAAAERPLMLAGVDVLNENAAAEVEAFCRQHGVPLITSYKGKGIIPEDDPLALGGAGLSPRADEHLLPLLRASDCLILAGYDPIEMRIGWRDPWAPDARVIDIAAEPNSHYMHQGAINFVCAAAPALAALGDGQTVKASWPDGEPSNARAALKALVQLDEDWGPAAVVDSCRKALPRDAVITVDSGAHRIVLSQAWESYLARGLLQSTALCTMGSAVPLAIGRKLAEPGRAVAAFVGDAGLEMFLGELATARDLKLGLPIVVFIDHSLALIELKQRGSRMPSLAVDFEGTDLPAVARAMGGEGVLCGDRKSLMQAMQDALTRDTFTVIAVAIGRKAYDGRI